MGTPPVRCAQCRQISSTPVEHVGSLLYVDRCEEEEDISQPKVDLCAPIMASIIDNDFKVVKELVEMGTCLKFTTFTWTSPAKAAVQFADLDMLQLLVEYRAIVDQTIWRRSALPIAVSRGSVDVLKVLLEARAQPHKLAREDGVTILDLARQTSFSDVVETLRSYIPEEEPATSAPVLPTPEERGPTPPQPRVRPALRRSRPFSSVLANSLGRT